MSAIPTAPLTVVVLHGHDDAPVTSLDLAALDPGGSVRVVGPAGPVDTGGGRRAWWRSDGDGAPVAHDVDSAVAVVDVAVRVASTAGPVVLGGFSQGGALALAATTRAGLPTELADALAGVFSVGAWYPDLPGVDPDLAGAAVRRLPALVAHGSDDQQVDLLAGRSSARLLHRAGLPVTWVELDAGHALAPALPALAAWLGAIGRGERPDAPP